MPSWPTSLPEFQIPLQIRRQDGTIRTSMDSGPDKVRRRFSAISKYFSIAMNMDGSELGTLDSFYDTTLQGGSLSFDMNDPQTGVSASFRFTEPPQATQRVGNSNTDKRLWDITLTLEKLP